MATITPARPGVAARSARRRTILQLVDRLAIGSQEELAIRLRERGFAVTQATVSRDVADLGLVKVPRGDRHVYVTPRALMAGDAGPGVTRGDRAAPAGLRSAPGAPDRGDPTAARDAAPGAASGAEPHATPAAHPGTARLRRILADYPVRVARSGLSLVVLSTSGTAAVIAQAIDESDLDDQVGTLAGDNTLLVLFADEPALERWRARFGAILQQATAGLDGDDLAGTYP